MLDYKYKYIIYQDYILSGTLEDSIRYGINSPTAIFCPHATMIDLVDLTGAHSVPGIIPTWHRGAYWPVSRAQYMIPQELLTVQERYA
jgi:hypothetical protein